MSKKIRFYIVEEIQQEWPYHVDLCLFRNSAIRRGWSTVRNEFASAAMTVDLSSLLGSPACLACTLTRMPWAKPMIYSYNKDWRSWEKVCEATVKRKSFLESAWTGQIRKRTYLSQCWCMSSKNASVCPMWVGRTGRPLCFNLERDRIWKNFCPRYPDLFSAR